MINKKIGAGFLVLGLLIGGGVMMAKQSHAQSSAVITPVVNIQGDVKTAGDTDNIQDPNGVEKPDTVSKNTASQVGETETANDNDGGANEDAN